MGLFVTVSRKFRMSERVAGIIGGMGPEATVDLMARVIKATPAADDMDHIRMVVDNNPKVPSRIRHLIEQTGDSALPCLQDMARKLAGWGVDFLAMPCNTAHVYYSGLQEAVNIPVLDMIELTIDRAVAENPGLRNVGLLASTAVLDLGLYEKRLAEEGLGQMTPGVANQELVMAAIRKIKTGSYGHEVIDVIQTAADDMIDRGCETLIVACTELSIISASLQLPHPCLDAAQVLAEAIVEFAQET
jgi:aspartate racemase